MSMWTGASDALTDYLAQREVEQQRDLVNRTALRERQYQRGRDVITDQRNAEADQRAAAAQALAEKRQAQADEDRKAQLAENAKNDRFRTATTLHTTMQPGGVTSDAKRYDLLDEFGLADDVSQKVALPVLRVGVNRSQQPVKEGDLAPISTERTMAPGAAYDYTAGGTDYQAKQREIEARKVAAAAAAADAADRQRERLDAAAATHADTLALRRELAAQREGGDAAEPLTDAALNTAAKLYLSTGSMGSVVGRGPIAERNRAAIAKRAGELDPDADIAANKVTLNADRASLAKATQAADALGALEQTGLKNLDVFLGTAGKVADTGSSLLNEPVRKVLGMFGQEEQAAFSTAHAALVPELARILHSGVSGSSGPLTDNARHDIEAVLSKTATVKQYGAVAAILRTDIANRKQATQDEIATIKGRIATRGQRATDKAPDAAAGNAGATTAAAPGVWTRDASGKLVRQQ